MRRTNLPSAPCPNWRDPDMPVLRTYHMADGTLRTVIDPTYEQRYRTHLLSTTSQPAWHRDPTYNLRRTKCPT